MLHRTDDVAARADQHGAIRGASRGQDAGGANLSRVRAHNERLVLTLLRSGAHSRAELARRTGLSAQTISQIVRAPRRRRADPQR